MIVRTKLAIPQLRSAPVPRPRLMRKLNEGLNARLTLVSGQSGYGKTTALSQWAREANLPVAWLSLDRQDNDWIAFWSGVTAAIETVAPGFGASVMPLVKEGPSSAAASVSASTPAWSSEPAIKALLNALHDLAGELAIVLDDYQFIELPAIHRSWAYFVERLPDTVYLYVASRVDPAIPTARLLARQELRRVTTDDLRFDADEGRVFFELKAGLALTGEQTSALVRQTEGWISGLQLAAISLGRSPDPASFIRQFSGRQQHISDYLLEEVLRDLEEPLQAFLRETSVLARMNPQLCEAVTGRTDCRALLARLEQLNLFLIPLDEERHWYRYHHLLSDFLRNQFAGTDPEGWAAAHARAARALEGQGFVEEAGEHYLEGRQYGDAVRLIERHLPDLIRSRGATLSRWVLRLPEGCLEGKPMAEMFYLLLLTGSGQKELAACKIGEARVRYEALQGAMDETAWRSVMGNLYFLSGVACYLLKDLDGVTAYFELAERLFPEARLLRSVSFNNNHVLDEFDDHMGYLNDYHAALEFMDRWLGVWGDNLAHPFVLSLQTSFSKLLYEWNRLEEAEACVRRLLGRSDTPPVARTLLYLYGSASRILQARGRPAEASDLLVQLRAHVDSPDYDLYMRRIGAEEACLRLRQGRPDQAAQWLAQCGMSHADEVSLGSVAEQLALAKVLAACGREAEALDLAERLYALLCREDRLRDRVQALLAQCAALRGLGRTDEALVRLDTALRLAEPQGFVRSFVDEGEGMAELLAAYAGTEARGNAGAFAYARRLLQAVADEMAGRMAVRAAADGDGADRPTVRETADGDGAGSPAVRETADGDGAGRQTVREAADGDGAGSPGESRGAAVRAQAAVRGAAKTGGAAERTQTTGDDGTYDGMLSVNCFGRFKVSDPDGREVRWRTSKAEELLAYLVHHRGEAVDRYRIMDALWDDDSTKTSANLHTTVHLLRKTLGSIGIKDVVQHNRGFYRVDTDILDCDYLTFEAWVSAGMSLTEDNIDRCEAIAKLYAGPYLSDNGYHWSDPIGKSLENEFLALLLQIYDYYMGDGNYPAAIAVMKRALKHAAWREDVHVRLIQAYLANKDRIAALKQYDALKRMLRVEYRLEPGDEAKRLLNLR
ncbi:BTAD domain-containing putative transcriptional regulator [Cohnella hashimotonis]|uniref:BTAD domain-containing putative transcriptional regulator n=1 Tax=Cohnella hashimotonis TaxID=2826895 RepID=A0ABT6TQU2_9BACL|nr:BTAD domain-containing putative transcriptional regulator [Cohnella hashimotonis]MDI4649203.1 BTAD domain-containing putative transcriptional regulator [Cohnella hashimotonis]